MKPHVFLLYVEGDCGTSRPFESFGQSPGDQICDVSTKKTGVSQTSDWTKEELFPLVSVGNEDLETWINGI